MSEKEVSQDVTNEDLEAAAAEMRGEQAEPTEDPAEEELDEEMEEETKLEELEIKLESDDDNGELEDEQYKEDREEIDWDTILNDENNYEIKAPKAENENKNVADPNQYRQHQHDRIV